LAAFRYSAVDPDGRQQAGVLEADNARAARQMLRSRDLVVLNVEAVLSGSSRRGGLVFSRRLSQTDLSVLTRQLSSLLNAALPVADALTVLVEQSERQSLRELMAAVRTDVLGGSSLSAALARHPRQFPDLYRALIAAGEESGQLGSVLSSLADFIEERARLQQKITLAFVYPAIVTIVALLVVIGLLTYVVPQVVQVFTQTRQALPLLTRMMIGLSDFVRIEGWIILILVVVGVFVARRALRVPAVRLRWHRTILKAPVLGVLSRSINAARFAGTLSILVGSGVPILRSLQAAGETLSNDALRLRVGEASVRVREGFSLARALRTDDPHQRTPGQARLFPPVLIHLIASGEATGKLPEMLARAADMHAREAERRTLFFTSLLEPALILLMGGIVTLIVLSVLMPIIEINQLVH
jgi:general secretion pathway protein F